MLCNRSQVAGVLCECLTPGLPPALGVTPACDNSHSIPGPEDNEGGGIRSELPKPRPTCEKVTSLSLHPRSDILIRSPSSPECHAVNM